MEDQGNTPGIGDGKEKNVYPTLICLIILIILVLGAFIFVVMPQITGATLGHGSIPVLAFGIFSRRNDGDNQPGIVERVFELLFILGIGWLAWQLIIFIAGLFGFG